MSRVRSLMHIKIVFSKPVFYFYLENVKKMFILSYLVSYTKKPQEIEQFKKMISIITIL